MPINYRQEALDEAGSRGAYGDVLRTIPLATRAAYYIIVAATVFALGFVCFGQVERYARGPLVIRLDGRTTVTALTDGAISAVDVRPGQAVSPGTVLARLDTREIAGEVMRLRREQDARKRALLRNLDDADNRVALLSLSSELELAQRKLAEHSVIAPCAGSVADVRIRPGQVVAKGSQLVTVTTPTTRARVVAALPAHERPLLRIGGPLRVELSGYSYAYLPASIRLIGDEALGPREVRRYLGDELGDAVEVEGPRVLVEAELATTSFVIEDQTLRFVDGMAGLAEAEVRRERIVTLLVPALRLLLNE